MRRSIPAVAVIAAGLLAGCGISDPYNDRDPDRAQRDRAVETLPGPPATGEMPSDAPEGLRKPDRRSFGSAGATPKATLRRAARLSVNWTRETAPQVFDELVAISDGPAEAHLLGVAGQARTSLQQMAAGARSEGSVQALVIRGEGDRRSALIVTRERVTGDGLRAQAPSYRVTLAEVERRGDRWVVTEWEPQA